MGDLGPEDGGRILGELDDEDDEENGFSEGMNDYMDSENSDV